ncbi:MAG: cytochrome c biogenesis protein CcsA [Fimbriimonas sp.]|nr:cytochrome c biogenesis protein CcsA [Fimbriimonas sp.]
MTPPVPPDWSLTTGDLGRYAVLLAALLFTFATVGWLLAPRMPKLSKVASIAITIGVLSLFTAFVSLGALFVGNRFEYGYVYQHGDNTNALAYRIAGIWSGQQGSFLLWACASGLFLILTARGTGAFRRWYSVAYGTFMAALAGILAFESPFDLARVDGQVVVPANGAGLAPSLQNYWVTIHPPTIFLGFGALTVLFAYGFAALVEGDFTNWLKQVRPWALVATSLLGLGLCMGGFWAYETLGWGGFWMWDPVENVSFVPWCISIAFIHGIVIQTARGTKKFGNLFLSGMPFLSFLYGTFLTRSGFLADASVHSFAEMNRSALKLLIGLMVIAFGSFAGLMIWRSVTERRKAATVAENSAEASAFGRESLINIGIATVSAIGVATLIGMSIPFVQALRHQPSKVVEEGLYHQVLTWFFIPTLILMAIAPFASWRKATAKDAINRFYSILCVSVGVTGLFMISLVYTPFGKVVDHSPVVTLVGKHNLPGMAWMLFLVGTCSFAIIGNVWRIAELRKASRLGWSPFLAHIGLVMLMVGLIVSRGFEQKDQIMVMKDHPGKALGYVFKYRKMTSTDHDHNNHVLFDVYDADDPKQLLFTAAPGMYKVPADDGNENTMVWPAIVHRPLYDVYVSLRPPQGEVSDPMPIKEGETKVFGGLVIKYDKMSMNGQPGQPGTAFVANLAISAGNKTRMVQPSISLGSDGGPTHQSVALDDNLKVSVASINAADRSINLQFELNDPMYPIDVYHKPMVMLVWLGTGLMTVAGLLVAVYRRVPYVSKAAEKVTAPAAKKGQRLAKQNV